MIRVAEIRQTCEACPSQWEGSLDDGRMIYVRYRWGYLSIRLSPSSTSDVYDAVGGEEVFGKRHGDAFGGELYYHELRDITIGLIEWPDEPEMRLP